MFLDLLKKLIGKGIIGEAYNVEKIYPKNVFALKMYPKPRTQSDKIMTIGMLFIRKIFKIFKIFSLKSTVE